MTINAVLFDMDGLMFDTERMSEREWIAIGKRNNVNITSADISLLRGKNRAAGKEAFEKRFGTDIPFEAWAIETRQAMRAQLEIAIPQRPFLMELLRFLQEQNIKMAVASSTNSKMVEQNLQKAGVRDYFSAVIGGDQVQESKPSPEIFIKAAAALNTPVTQCIVLEDSYSGVRAGAAAGCYTVMVPDLDPATPEMQTLARAIVPSLAEVISLIQAMQKEEKDVS